MATLELTIEQHAQLMIEQLRALKNEIDDQTTRRYIDMAITRQSMIARQPHTKEELK